MSLAAAAQGKTNKETTQFVSSSRMWPVAEASAPNETSYKRSSDLGHISLESLRARASAKCWMTQEMNRTEPTKVRSLGEREAVF